MYTGSEGRNRYRQDDGYNDHDQPYRGERYGGDEYHGRSRSYDYGDEYHRNGSYSYEERDHRNIHNQSTEYRRRPYEPESHWEGYNYRRGGADSCRKRKYEDEDREDNYSSRKRWHRADDDIGGAHQGRWRDDSREENDLYRSRYHNRGDASRSFGYNHVNRNSRNRRTSYERDDHSERNWRGIRRRDTRESESVINRMKNCASDENEMSQMDIASSVGDEQYTARRTTDCIDVEKEFPFGFADLPPQEWNCEPISRSRSVINNQADPEQGLLEDAGELREEDVMCFKAGQSDQQNGDNMIA